jgi:hypothetical protein
MGSVRIVSKRKDGIQADPSEVVVDVDRTHPILGNPHILADHRDKARRAEVIDLYSRDLERDWAQSGPKKKAILALAARVEAGERIALRCWCAPERCHAELIRDRIAQALNLKPEVLDPSARPKPMQASLF